MKHSPLSDPVRITFLLVGMFLGSLAVHAIAAPGEVARQIRLNDPNAPGGAITLEDSAEFGSGVAALGDLNSDGVEDLAVGAAGLGDSGAVYIFFLNSDGSVKSQVRIADGESGLPANTLAMDDNFGARVENLGDLDGDGNPELAASVSRGTNGSTPGAVYILFLNRNGTVKTVQKIANGEGGLAPNTLDPSNKFGSALAKLGDLDGDGVTELAVGAEGGGVGNPPLGQVFILFLNANGTVKQQETIGDGQNGFGSNLIESVDLFGCSLSTIGDLDCDGIPELVVGTKEEDTGATNAGSVYVLFLSTTGDLVKSVVQIGDGVGGLSGSALSASNRFGSAIENAGDLNGDGVPDMIVGAETASGTSGASEGAIFVLLMNADGTVKSHLKIANGLGGLAAGSFFSISRFGSSITRLGDLDEDGIPEFAVGVKQALIPSNRPGDALILSLGDAPITVTTAADEFDTPSGANVSLREAIRDAEATGEFREILFQPSLNGSTITLTETLDIVSGQSLRITAKDLPDGITISGDGQHQIIEHVGDALTLECLNLENGFEGGSGGGIEAFTSSALFVNQVTFRRCISTSSLARGGAISSSGFAKITNSTFIENEADEGGAISMTLGTAQLQAINCTFISNSATTLSDPNDGGGAILCSGIDAASINFCTFIENSAVQGSALLTDNSTVTLRNCLFPGSTFVIDFVNGGIANEFESRFPDLDDLAPLANYNGKIPTRPLLPTATDINGVPFLPLPTTDQNGLPRTRNGGSDPGAAEAIELTDYQPDNLIGEKRGRQKGNNLYNTTGAGQKVRVKLRGRKKFKTFMTVQNDGIFPDSFIMRSNKPNKRTLKLKVRQLGGGNVTAALRRGLPLLNLAPGQSVAFKADYKRKSKDRKARGKLRFTSTSSFFGKSDTVQAKIKSLRERRR